MITDKTSIDADHEIEEFLQTYIVEKIISGYKEKLETIETGVDELQDLIKKLKNANNTTNVDIAKLIENDKEFLENWDEINKKAKDVDKNIKAIMKSQKEITSAIPNDEKIIESLSNKWIEISNKKIAPIQKDILACIEDVLELSNVVCGVARKVDLLPVIMCEAQSKFKEILIELSKLNNLLQAEQVSIHEIINVTKKIEESISKKGEVILENGNMIMNEIQRLNRKFSFLWITVGINSLLILGLLVAFICK